MEVLDADEVELEDVELGAEVVLAVVDVVVWPATSVAARAREMIVYCIMAAVGDNE